jgi:hypothetical protein
VLTRGDGKDGRDCGCDGGGAGSGGDGGFQAGVQLANTQQWAGALGVSKQNAVNGNSPVSTAGRDVNGGSSSATQNANSTGEAKAKNDAYTEQHQHQHQNVGAGCGCKRKPVILQPGGSEGTPWDTSSPLPVYAEDR